MIEECYYNRIENILYAISVWWSPQTKTRGRKFINNSVFENIPKSYCLISSASEDILSTWTFCKIKNSLAVSRKSSNFLHISLIPYNYLIERVAMCGDNLSAILWEYQVAYLRTCVNAVDLFQLLRIIYPDTSVCSTSSKCQYVVLVRRETYRLNSCSALRYLCQFPAHLQWPQKHFVVITSWC